MDIQTKFDSYTGLLPLYDNLKIHKRSGLPIRAHNHYRQIFGILNRFVPNGSLYEFIRGGKTLEAYCKTVTCTFEGHCVAEVVRNYLTDHYKYLFEKSSFEDGTYFKIDSFDEPYLKNLRNNQEILDVFVFKKGAQLDLNGIDFSKCNLLGIDLSGIDLSYAKFIDAILYSASFERSTLYSADFTKAYLNGVNLIGTNLTGARFIESHLRNTFLCTANCTDADLSGAIIINTNLFGTNLIGAKLPTDILSDASLLGAKSFDPVVQKVINKHNNEFMNFGRVNKLARLEGADFIAVAKDN